MSKDQNNNPGHGGKEDVMEPQKFDALDHAIFSAIAWSTAASSEELNSVPELSDDDSAAFDALGTPEEVADRIMARPERAKSAAKSRASTHGHCLPANETTFESPEDSAVRDAEFKELLAQHQACHEVTHFQWEYQFVKVMQEIGQGGQGVVYRAASENSFIGSVALKIFSPEPYPDVQSYCQDMERMRAVAAVVHQNYPNNLICVEHFASLHGVYFIFMRLIDGFDLLRLLDADVIGQLRRSVSPRRWGELSESVFVWRENGQWALAPGVAVNIVEKCLWGLQALHEKRIVHCDIKPSNIMLDCYGAIRIIDIGSAFEIGAPPRRPSWTARYAPPEVLEKDDWTEQGDLASLGYVLVELLCGPAVLAEPTVNSTLVHTLEKEGRLEMAKEKRELYDRLYDLIPARTRQSPRLMELLRKLIAPNRADRFASAEEAFNVAASFRDELAAAGLAMPWVKVTRDWVTDVKKGAWSYD
jgi:serine/threonine-protein kinase